MTTELIANSPTPGSRVPIATLAAAITTTGATTLTSSGAAPTALQGSGQFRIVIDSEIMIVTAGAAGTTWTVTRGAESSTAATHSNGASIYHDLTAAALTNLLTPAVTGNLATNLGTAQNLALTAGQQQWLEGVLNANLTLTITAFPLGAQGKLIAQQDATGGRTLTVAVSGGGSTIVPVPATPGGAPCEVLIESADGTASGVVVTLLSNPDASATQKGAVTLSVAPAVATTPVAVGQNDPAIPHFQFLSANLTAITSQTTLQNVTGLAFNIGTSATEVWLVKWYIALSSANATMDVKFALATAPTGATAQFGWFGNANGGFGGTGTAGTLTNYVGFGTALSGGTAASGNQGNALIAIIQGGGNAGAIQLQYAQNTSDVGALQILAGSTMEYVRIRS